jgi:hypothetical protein
MKQFILKNSKDLFYGAVLFTQIALIVCKINEVIDMSWWFVFAPTLIFPMVFFGLWLAMFCYFLYKNLSWKRTLKSDLKEIEKLNKEMKDILKEDGKH